MDAVFLSRIQFAVTTMFHILFPVLTIGLALYLVVVEFLWLMTKQEVYYRLYRFWVKIFAINFGVGVVSGVVLEFEFGTNFSRFSQAVGNVFSPLLGFEVMTAFFLEAGFLGIMLFGWERVHRNLHFLATCLVAFGSILSAFWILAANSWMQTPAGYQLVNGKFMVTDFSAVIFNPSLLARMGHMTMASFETSAFVVAGISAYYLLKEKHTALFRRSLAISLAMALFFAPLQIYLGDVSGRQVFHHQPAKLAAMEAHWETNAEGGAPFAVVAFTDMEAEKNLFELNIPNGLSLLVTHSFDGRVQGLKEFPRNDRPNVFILFWSFRLMVAIGFILFFVMVWAVVLWRQGRLYNHRPFLRTLMVLHPLGFIATELGWMTTEVGRQPWLVYNLMRTSEGVSPIPAGNVIWSLSLFLIIFPVIGASYFYYILKTLARGPDLASPIPLIQRPAGMQPLMNSKIEELED
ncbi:MAG: cytochrome D ubiquinol oxidase subunit I [Deltaproteobacteria bacterium RBG_16_47_11]|nr:MAG: cytochrome D ubiquinol oxidase subunit I [Deltaproteobacteria bacterium RBG_16_47_11]